MADEVVAQTSVTPAPEPVQTVTPTPVVTPTDTTPVPVEQAPPVATAPAVETNTETPAPAVETPVEKPAETILGEAPKEAIEEIKSDEPVKSEESTQTEGGQSEETAPPPKYEPFVLPEDIKLDETRLGEFTNLLVELETSGKASHEAVQAFGQKAVDFHINEVKKAVESVTDFYQKAWEKQKIDWKDAFLKDPEIGGNRFQTTVDAAQTFINTHGGTPEQQKEFRNLMEVSGLGNHPAMIRILAKAMSAMQEGKPMAAVKPVQATKSRTQTLYGKS